MRKLLAALVALIAFAAPAHAWQDRSARNGDVTINYHVEGRAADPIVIMLHGFPDFSGSWRALSGDLARARYRTIAVDMRGYNGSSAPAGVENYTFAHLMGDIDAVLNAEAPGRSATVIGHDWGAAVAWQYAMTRPDRVKNLVIISVPHPAGFAREMATNAEQQRNSEYARQFQQAGAENALTAEGLAGWAPEARRAEYVAAFRRSNFAAMLNYYRANYPQTTGASLQQQQAQLASLPPIQSPVLVIHGLNDTALNAAGHNGTWDHVARDTTVMVLPGAGHWAHLDRADLVNPTIVNWLALRNADTDVVSVGNRRGQR